MPGFPHLGVDEPVEKLRSGASGVSSTNRRVSSTSFSTEFERYFIYLNQLFSGVFHIPTPPTVTTGII
jgi:hypothetical protein